MSGLEDIITEELTRIEVQDGRTLSDTEKKQWRLYMVFVANTAVESSRSAEANISAEHPQTGLGTMGTICHQTD